MPCEDSYGSHIENSYWEKKNREKIKTTAKYAV